MSASGHWFFGSEWGVSLHRTATAYDVVAGPYQERFLDELAEKPRDRELLDELGSKGAGPILDVGCGPGQIGAHLQGGGRHVFGVDASHEMALRASRRLMSAVVADMLALPFADHCVSGIVAFYSVIHLPRTELGRAFDEFARVLEARGHVVVSAHEGDGKAHVTEFLGREVDLDASFFTLDELTGSATAAGFEVVSAERRPPYPNEGSTVRLYVYATKGT